jgi:hypothetical protein
VINGPGAITPTATTTGADGKARTKFTAGTTPGTTMVAVRATLDGVTVERVVTLETRMPCVGCPLDITGPGHVPKGGSAIYESNQIVAWTATGGSITGSGTYKAGNEGGAWTITATSLENPGTTQTRDIIIECDASDLVGVYSGLQNIVVDASGCGSSSPASPGTVTIADHPLGTNRDIDISYQWQTTPMVCGDSFGVGDPQPPVIADGTCSASKSVNVGGCIVGQISFNVVGPGVHGISGSYEQSFFVNGTCNPAEQSMFELVKQ